MKNYDKIANSVFERRDKYIAKQKKKKRIIISIVTPVVCCVVLVLSFGLWNRGFFNNNIPVIDNSQNASDISSSNNNQSRPSSGSNSSQKNNTSAYLTQSENNSSSENPPAQNNPSTNDITMSSDNTTQSNTTQGNTTPGNTTPGNTTSENIDNGVLEKAISQKMDLPENMKLLSTDNAKEENNSKITNATAVFYKLDGDVVNWTTENDFIYVITSANNRLVVIDSKTMAAVYNIPLGGKPAEINLTGDNIYISLPDLCRIDVFSKTNFAKKTSLYFEQEVSSFCIDGNYIFYSEHDQWCRVYRMNIVTKELRKISGGSNGCFYYPKLYLNKEDNILYIGETGSSGSALYYYDATTLKLKSYFKKNNYGIMNHTRDIFHMGDEVFWGNYRFSDTNAKQIIGRYGGAEYGSINFVSEELVSTFEGIFLTDTYECVVNYLNTGFKFDYILVTDSYNIFFRERSTDRNIIVGVNFNIQ